LAQREAAYLKFADDLTDLKMEHRAKFNEKLDTASLYKIVTDRQIPLDVAYNLMIADKVEEKRATDLAEQLKHAREEGAAEYATKHNLPVISSQNDLVHVLDSQEGIGKTQKDRVRAALDGFAKSMNGR
jgi:hypothetical protein